MTYWVYSPTWEEHLKHLEALLDVLQRNTLRANYKQCSFGRTELDYLGHVISGEGVAVDAKKIEAVVHWPRPQTLRELRGFLGLVGYYWKFVAGYNNIAWPLTDQLKWDNFGWTVEAEAAPERLKEVLCSGPVLALPDFTAFCGRDGRFGLQHWHCDDAEPASHCVL